MSTQYVGLNSMSYEESVLTKSKEMFTPAADIKVKIISETLPSLFRLSMQNLNQLLYPNFDYRNHKKVVTQTIDLQSADITSLLIEFLSKVLTLSQVNKTIFFELAIKTMTDNTLTGVLNGRTVERFQEEVKTVTCHETEVTVNDQGNWETVILFDIQ